MKYPKDFNEKILDKEEVINVIKFHIEVFEGEGFKKVKTSYSNLVDNYQREGKKMNSRMKFDVKKGTDLETYVRYNSKLQLLGQGVSISTLENFTIDEMFDDMVGIGRSKDDWSIGRDLYVYLRHNITKVDKIIDEVLNIDN
tara:strand:+ start:3744 stop:4169 length:426 start_codon:yes stop_codon:yes gene_type:complete